MATKSRCELCSGKFVGFYFIEVRFIEIVVIVCGQLTRRLDKYYGLSPGLLSLVFDGDKLTPDQTPQSLDMEEGDDVLIDVKVDKSLYDQAVATATKK